MKATTLSIDLKHRIDHQQEIVFDFEAKLRPKFIPAFRAAFVNPKTILRSYQPRTPLPQDSTEYN
jgi:hypothetical protein